MLEKRVSMEEVKKRLKDSNNFPEWEITKKFAESLADELGNAESPIEFYVSSLRTIRKMKEKGEYSLPIYSSLVMHITEVADRVCPKEFAELVKIIDRNHYSARGDLYPEK